MGKRIIISESEKKNILSLYEQSNFPIPPPKNSILITKKNPYKYDEFSNARQTYSTKLKDGDMFYIMGLLPDELNIEIIKEKVNNDFGKSLINKTIRIPNTNEVLTIKEFYFGAESGLINKGKIGRFKLDNGNFIDMFLSFDSGSGNGVSIKIKESNDYSDNGVIIPKLSEYYNNNFLNRLTSVVEKSNVTKLPDEYFEIRKVLTPKSDF
jgi:hypothetical protein